MTLIVHQVLKEKKEDGLIDLEKAKKNQEKFKSNLNEIKRGKL